jgi:hypothetical protein
MNLKSVTMCEKSKAQKNILDNCTYTGFQNMQKQAMYYLGMYYYLYIINMHYLYIINVLFINND